MSRCTQNLLPGVRVYFVLLAFTGAAMAQEQPAVREIVVVFKTHFDIGYTDLAANVVTSYRTTMIDKALAVCGQNEALPPEQRFVWTLPAWPMAQIAGPEQAPERREKILGALREGRFVFHGLPFTLHTESLEPEDIVRGLGHAARIARDLGQDAPRDAKMTDVPSHSWILPSVLSRAGIEFLHLGCNAGSASPDVPPLFWWEGPDGARILTMYTAEAYGTGVIPPKEWPYPVWLALIHAGDNEGPPTPEAVGALLAEAGHKLPGIPVRIGRLSDFSDALRKYSPGIPVVRGDMPDTWIHGIMSMPIETALARRGRPMLAAWESLNTLLKTWGVDSAPPAARIETAYEHSLLFGEHTWGMDVKRFGPRLYGDDWKSARDKGLYGELEASWREKGAHILKMSALLQQGVSENLDRLAENVRVTGKRIAVYNPLPWPRTGVVDIVVEQDFPAALRTIDCGDVLPAERHGASLRFIARNVPPMGYTTYIWAESPPGDQACAPQCDAEEGALENGFFKILVNKNTGAIRSLLDKRTGRNWVQMEEHPEFGQYFYERFSKDEVEEYVRAYAKIDADWAREDFGKSGLPSAGQAPRQAGTMTPYAVEAVAGPCSASLIVQGYVHPRHAEKIRVAYTLYQDLPYVDITWEIREKQPTPWPEAGWLCLPFDCTEPTFLLGRLGGLVDPAKDILPGANHDIYCLNSGMAILEKGNRGIGICPLDAPLVSLARPGLWKYSRDFAAGKASVFINLFNNQWSTNFQQWTGGSWKSTVRVWSFESFTAEKDLCRPAAEARSPLCAAVYEGPPGLLPPQRAGMSLSRKGIAVTSFARAEGESGLCLRLWEQAGAGGPCEIQLPQEFGDGVVRACDERGRLMGAAWPMKQGRFTMEIPAFAPVTVLLPPPGD